MNTPPLRVIITGGTFDKVYDPRAGALTFQNTHLPDILRQARVTAPVELEILPLIDSLDMREEGRARMAESCRRAPESAIVITHGTDTMTETARVLAAAGLGKTIVLTGAMVPFAFGQSDALFNFGGAVLAASLLPPGVYVTMNGRVFRAGHVRKNRESGCFEETGAS